MIKLTSGGSEVKYELSIFPDGTSQLWKIDFSPFDVNFEITWVWENKEQELFHVCQLVDLLRNFAPHAEIHLYCPYLPFARQDKETSNTTTFALSTFASIINSKKFTTVRSVDPHSKKSGELINNFFRISVYHFHEQVLNEFKPDIICYPDKGASERYNIKGYPVIYGEKVRNQTTGNIDSYAIINPSEVILEDRAILIVDDICDGGKTFELVGYALPKSSSVGLCVTHGIFSKGLDSLLKSNVRRFYYTNSLLKNKDGFKVWE